MLQIYIVITEKSRDRIVVEIGVKHHSIYHNPIQNVNDTQKIQIRKNKKSNEPIVLLRNIGAFELSVKYSVESYYERINYLFWDIYGTT